MNNIKKIFGFLFIAILALVLIGCGGGGNTPVVNDEAVLEEQADKIYLGDLSEVSSDIKLPKYAFGNKEFAVTWTSSNEKVIKVQEFTNADKDLYFQAYVTMALEETKVTLTATVAYKDLTTTREFVVTVLADEYAGYENIAAVKAKDDKEKDVSKVKFSGTVSFTTSSGFGVSDDSATIYCYGSNHGRTVGEIVEVRGVWTYYNNMVQLATGANVKVLGTEAFNIADIAEEKTISEIASIVAKSVDPENCTRVFKTTFAAKENAAGSYNVYKLVDPLDNSKFVDVSKYNDATTIAEVGELAATDKFYSGIVIIYCSRSAGAAGLWDVLYVPGSAVETEVTLSDAQKVSGLVSDLAAEFNGKTFDKDLVLPTTNEATGATISWASSNEEIIGADGKFTAPAAKTEVKLTATITLNAEVQTVEVSVFAKGKDVTVATLVTTPEVGVAYKLGINQKEAGKMLYATGLMNGYYGATTEDHTAGVDVVLEATEGGYYITCTVDGAKKYISVVLSGTHKNFVYEDAPSCVWVYNTEFNTVTTTVGEFELFIGTRGTYTTVGAYTTAELAADFPVNFYKEEVKTPYAKEVEVGVAYKLGIDQQTAEKMLYATGLMNGYYGATTEVYSEGVDVVLEVTEGGYYITCTVDGAKKYISVVLSGTHKNFVYEDAPSCVWVYNTEFNTVTTTVGEFELFIGTRGTYTTVGAYTTDELAADFPVRFYAENPDGGNEDGGNEDGGNEEQPVVPSVEETTVSKLLEKAASLADGEVLNGTFKVTGLVTEIDSVYNEQFGNVSFYLSDGTNSILCYRVKGDAAALVAVGDTITLTGKVKNYMGTIEVVEATIDERVAGDPVQPDDKEEAMVSITFADVANRTEFDSDHQVWEMNGVKITNNQAGSTSPVADYYAPARFYKSSELVFEYETAFKKIVITTAGGKCYSSTDTIEGATLTVDGKVMTIVLDEAATSFTIAALATQIRVDQIDFLAE